jgi:hypothetical protein
MIWTNSWKCGSNLVSGARGRGSVPDTTSATIPGRGVNHDHPVGQEHRLGDAVGDEYRHPLLFSGSCRNRHDTLSVAVSFGGQRHNVFAP